MKVVQSCDKGDLELLLNVIVTDAANIAGTLRALQQNACNQELVEFWSKQAESKANYIANIASQTLHAWDMEEYHPDHNDDYDKLMKQARKKVGHFEHIEWQG